MNILKRFAACLVVLGTLCSSVHAETVFTYQGKLGSAGQPANGAHDFRFRLFDAQTGGSQVGSLLTVSPVTVSSGVFTVQLDFGDAPFNSNPRWLEIDVREVGGGAYTTLSPRQRVGAAPFAIETMFVAPDSVDNAALQNGVVNRSKMAPDAIGTFQIQDNSVTGGDIRDASVAGVDIAGQSISGSHIANGGGLLHRKSELQRVASIAKTIIGGASSTVTASCADANDIPIAYDCEVITNIHLMTMREATTANWDNETVAASATCAFQNQHPTIAGDVRAAITCLAVP